MDTIANEASQVVVLLQSGMRQCDDLPIDEFSAVSRD